MSKDPFRIAVVGAGFCGTVVAVHLLRQSSTRPVEITLIDGVPSRLGKGVAYSPFSSAHLLNVPAAAMGAFADDPQGFYRWLTSNEFNVQPQQFVPREWYGAYLDSLLNSSSDEGASRNRRLVQKNIKISALRRDGAEFVLESEDGAAVRSDCVVVATGNLPQGMPVGGAELEKCGLLVDPWKVDALKGLKGDGAICVLGTGLTAIDVILDAVRRKLPNKIIAISRRGRFPQPHATGEIPPLNKPLNFTGVNTARGLTRLVRKHSEENSWYAVVDSIRPDAQSIWADLPTVEKRRFVRHLRRFWDSHRHRMPPQVAETLQNMVAAGQLNVIAANIRSVEEKAGKARVNIMRRGESEVQSLEVARVVNCTGPGSSVEKTKNKFVSSLIADGVLKKDPLGLGVVVSPEFGGADKLFVIGPLLKGILWETTAVRELRTQAASVAEQIGRIVNE